MSPGSHAHGRITMRLAASLAHYVAERNLGEMYAAETGFLLAHNPDTVLAPDVAFVRGDRVETIGAGDER